MGTRCRRFGCTSGIMEAAHDWLVCFGEERRSGDDETLLASFLTNSEPISD